MRYRCVHSLLRLYQLVISPGLHLLSGGGAGCRFNPSCSRYASECYESHRFGPATRLAFWRILRCHPWSAGGDDPAPHVKESEIKKRVTRTHLKIHHANPVRS